MDRKSLIEVAVAAEAVAAREEIIGDAELARRVGGCEADAQAAACEGFIGIGDPVVVGRVEKGFGTGGAVMIAARRWDSAAAIAAAAEVKHGRDVGFEGGMDDLDTDRV